jgi:hypothetical protein
MHALQVALYETQKKDAKLDTVPMSTVLSNDCLDHEDVILSCCAGLVYSKKVFGEFGSIVSFFRMSFSSQKQGPQYTDHCLC